MYEPDENLIFRRGSFLGWFFVNASRHCYWQNSSSHQDDIGDREIGRIGYWRWVTYRVPRVTVSSREISAPCEFKITLGFEFQYRFVQIPFLLPDGKSILRCCE
jgi:hypothetical protein